MDDPSTGQGQREPPAFLPPSMNPPDGPTFVLVTKEAGSFKTANPFAIKRELDKLCGPLKTAKTLRSGSLLVETDTGPQATLLMRTRVFHGSPVSVTLADRLNCVQGCIRSDSLAELSNEELLEELMSQGVVRVERLRSRNLRVLGPNPTVPPIVQGQRPATGSAVRLPPGTRAAVGPGAAAVQQLLGHRDARGARVPPPHSRLRALR